jgi:hypothetical protein
LSAISHIACLGRLESVDEIAGAIADGNGIFHGAAVGVFRNWAAVVLLVVMVATPRRAGCQLDLLQGFRKALAVVQSQPNRRLSSAIVDRSAAGRHLGRPEHANELSERRENVGTSVTAGQAKRFPASQKKNKFQSLYDGPITNLNIFCRRGDRMANFVLFGSKRRPSKIDFINVQSYFVVPPPKRVGPRIRNR